MTRKGASALVALALFAASPAARAEYVSQPVPQGALLGTGPYKAAMLAPQGLATHTLYRPADLSQVKGRMPIVVWGEGGCANEGNRFRWFLSEIASHGYVILAIGPIGASSVEIWTPPPPPPPGGPVLPKTLPQPATHSSQLIDAIDWALAENARAGSELYGRLDPTKIAVMGMSCGGAQAIEVSADPRISTSVMWNSGLFSDTTTMGGGKALTKADLQLIHAPVAYISGDSSDVAFANANDDFSRLSVPAFRGARKATGHGGTYGEPGGGDFGKVGVAWLDWRLKGDAAAGRMFLGPDCGLCKDPQWVVQQKNLH